MIAFLHGAPAWGMVERYVESIVRALREREEVMLVYPDAPVLERFSRLRVPTETFPPDRSALRQCLWLRDLLRGARPRLAHVTDVWPAAQVAARLARTPRVVVTHHTPELPRRDNLAGRLWWRLGWATRPEVIYTSEADRRGDGRPRSFVVPLGIDLERFGAAEPTLEKAGPLVGNVARLAEQKGQRYLLEAAARVVGRRPDVRFVLVGEGELRPALETQARSLGLGDRVLFAGARDDVPDLLASFDVFAFPSLFEGLCVAVIEAQAAGVPVVATPVGGIRETVVDGETGILVPPRDAEALAAAILRLLERPEEGRRLAAEARRRVRERFSEERMVEETLALYGPPA
ncbi:MAG: glycosyltransferase [Gaiellaceae bacterium]